MPTFYVDESYAIEIDSDFEGEKKSYSPVRVLGKGGNGIVLEAEDNLDGTHVAVKIELHSEFARRKRFKREIRLLKEISSDGIIKYLDEGRCMVTEIRRRKVQSSKEYFFVIMELGSCNLFKYVIEHYPIDYSVYAGNFLNLANGLWELHKNNVIHRDIKPQNVLVVNEKWVIADLGLCSVNSSSFDDDCHLTETGEMLGPRYWMSPEATNRLVDKTQHLSFSSDIFQLAAIFWFVINKTIPVGTLAKEDWKSKDSLFRELLLSSLLHNLNNRPQNGEVFYQALQDIVYAH